MNLLHGAWYVLPDGIHLQAIQTASGGFRLEVQGQPAYAVYPFGIRRLVYCFSSSALHGSS